jgi:hypothetical protein
VGERLHVFATYCEWVVARDEEDAAKVWCETVGATVEDLGDPFERWADDRVLSMWTDADGKICDIGEGTLQKRTCREWADAFGRGFLGTTEG